ncbi:oxidative stress-responsive serine-rich protein 1-like [Lytechinus pictus]|uniref:oxidative stress-responsive serine-rich protein 1-like n=1 Tax=Lytechinus pictus TaxID=7653 RepID=UPI0030B9DF52
MATSKPGAQSADDDWDDYLHGMFKKLKVDPEKLKDDTTYGTSATKQSSRWYNQSIKPPKKTRKSLALRSSRNRLSPYRSLLTCHGGKATCENPLIRSSKFTASSEQANRLAHGKMWSESGNVKVKFAAGVGKCSCPKQEVPCKCDTKKGGDVCRCGRKAPPCHIGSKCKSKLLSFRTLATIIEESGEAVPKEKRSEKKLFSAVPSYKLHDGDASKAACVRDASADASARPHFSNYRDGATGFKVSPKMHVPLAAPPTTTPFPSRSSVGPAGRTSNVSSRVPARPEYSCSQEARMAIDGLPDDTSVDDLAGYFDSIVYIPRKMSAMAEMMYT